MESLKQAEPRRALAQWHDPRWSLVGIFGLVVGVSFVSQMVYCLVGGWSVVPQKILAASLLWPAIVLFFLLVRKFPRDLRPGGRRRAERETPENSLQPIAYSPWIVVLGSGFLFWFPLGVMAATGLRAPSNNPVLAGDLLGHGLMLGFWILIPTLIAIGVQTIIFLRKPSPAPDDFPIRKLLP